jgi:large subunit ribosomal protein L10
VNLLTQGVRLSACALLIFDLQEVNGLDNPRPEKVAVVDEVKEKLSSSSAAILTEYRGLKVKDMATLRRSLREVGGEYRVYKNTLVRFAARDVGLVELESLLEGPTAITFIDGDAVAVAKALRDYARTNPNLVVKGGLLGQSVLSAAEAGALADLPSREVLLARIAGGLAAPLVQFAGLLQALPRNLAYGLKALVDKRVAGGEELPSPEPVTEPEAAAEPEAPAEATAATEPEAAAEPEAPAAESATEPEVAEPAAEAAAEPDAPAEPPAATEPEAAAEPEPEATAASEAAPEPEAAAEPEAAPEAGPEPEATSEVNAAEPVEGSPEVPESSE